MRIRRRKSRVREAVTMVNVKSLGEKFGQFEGYTGDLEICVPRDADLHLLLYSDEPGEDAEVCRCGGEYNEDP